MNNTQGKELFCNFCGSSNVEITQSSRFFPIPFGKNLNYENQVIYCKDCQEKQEIFSEHSVEHFLSNKNPSYVEAVQESIGLILVELKSQGYNQARIERAFDIPKRTISKWYHKKNFPSAASTALLRLTKVFPWLINCAENNYDIAICQKHALKWSMNHLYKQATQENITIQTALVPCTDDKFKGFELKIKLSADAQHSSTDSNCFNTTTRNDNSIMKCFTMIPTPTKTPALI